MTAVIIIEQILMLLVMLFLLFNMFKHVPKRGGELYNRVGVKGGLHMFCSENSLKSFELAIKAGLVISVDVRRTKDGKVVCFSDRYTKRLLGIPGKISMFDYAHIAKFNLKNTSEKVTLFEELLKVVGNKVPIHVCIRGRVSREYIVAIMKMVKRYNGKIYIETKNIYVYNSLNKKYRDSDEKYVYFMLNPFRKRPPFIKGKEYAFQQKKYYKLVEESRITLPTIHDISNIIVGSMVELENRKEILATIGKTINKYETRIGKGHWIYNSLWLHRSIVSNQYPEHSKESFKECLRFADKTNLNLTLEFDVMLYKGEIKCYHKDKISSVLGQDKSCAKKLDIDETLSLSEILEMTKGNPRINLAIDIKDFHFKNRELEEKIILQIENSGYDGNFILMSFNPMVLNYFKKSKPEWLRAQIGHSLKGLREKIPFFRFPWIITGLLGTLFDLSKADCVVMDNSNWLYYLISFHRNVQGKPVLIYAPKTYKEQEAFIGREFVANFIVENVSNEEDWPKEYLEKFKNTR